MSTPILVVDDDPIICEVVKSAMSEHGFEVEHAYNGDDAIELLQSGNYRVVITDWQMPGMNGLQLCSRIRSGDFGGYIYVILLTSMDSTEQRVEGLVAGADDFVTKPFHPTELIARVNVGKRVLQLETRETLIFALAKLAESRDPETGHHIERVQCYSRCLTEQLALNPDYADTITPQYIQLVYQTSPLHDIGKVGIPDEILLKPGKLTEDEFERIKEHPVIGAETLRGAIERSPEACFLRMAHDITRYHHEKFDGSGYPDGLAGTDIPLSARIVALADVYDALTTHRVYKDAFSHEKAEQIIVDGRGSHFDPSVVDAFLQVREVFQQIRKRFDDGAVLADVAPPVAKQDSIPTTPHAALPPDVAQPASV